MIHNGPFPVLSTTEAEQLRRRARAGWSVRAIALAHGVSLRTAYRYLHRETLPLERRLDDAIARWEARVGVTLTSDQRRDLAHTIRCIVQTERQP